MALVKPGDRIRLLHMPDDPDPIPPGTTGTVEEVHLNTGQIFVKWDIKRSLILLIDHDQFEVINAC